MTTKTNEKKLKNLKTLSYMFIPCKFVVLYNPIICFLQDISLKSSVVSHVIKSNNSTSLSLCPSKNDATFKTII
jgi:hypothetical protein